MCGIAGMVGPGASLEIGHRMNRQMHHRGPDDRGIFFEPGVLFGMTRLSIIDTSDRGHQPMQSHGGRYWIVYNGECYNFAEIRKKLEMEGDRFISNSDTEVVLAAFVRFGPECLRLFNGMFAFAIWDTVEKSCFVARDRFGIKPLYYCLNSNGFIFASEIKALLSSGRVAWEVNREAVLQYFTFGHILQPETIISSVKALMPGHYAVYRDGAIKVSRYWSLVKTGFDGSYEEAREMLLTKLSDSVRLQMISDRPLGLFLSGGLDSATLLYMMNRHGTDVTTFSIGFEDSPFAANESKEAAELATFFGAKHKAISLDGSMIRDDLTNYFQACDQPTIDGLNTYFVSKYAVNEMTVALNGLGSDELFAGYSRHARAYWKGKDRRLARLVTNRLAGAFLPLSNNASYASFFLKVLYRTEHSNARRNYVLSRILNFPGMTKRIVRETGVWDSWISKQINSFSCIDSDDFLEQSLHLEMQGFMSAMILRDSDAISMFNSLEVRFPFIDHHVVEFAFSLPSTFKIGSESRVHGRGEGVASYRTMGTKKILMDAMEPHLPKGFSSRPKHGFKIPLNLWLSRDLKELTRGILADKNQEGYSYVNAGNAGAIWDAFYETESNDFTLWSIVSFLGNVAELKRIHTDSAGKR